MSMVYLHKTPTNKAVMATTVATVDSKAMATMVALVAQCQGWPVKTEAAVALTVLFIVASAVALAVWWWLWLW